MGFFDFIDDLPHYAGRSTASKRMNHRHDFLINDFANDIAGAKVLDLASHDGRWCYGFAGAGATSVVGIEARPELVAEFSNSPDPALRAKVDMRVGDLFDGIRAEIAKGETYDVIGVFGILYHIMDHFSLFQLLRDLKPKLVIVIRIGVVSSSTQLLRLGRSNDIGGSTRRSLLLTLFFSSS